MGHRHISYTGPMLDVEPQQIHHHHHHHNHHPESCMVSYNGVRCFQPFNTRTMIPPSINFDPRYLPENHGHLPYMITQYNGEHCNAFMIPSPSSGPFSVPVLNRQIFERNRNLFMDGSNGLYKRSGSSFVGPMTSDGGAMGFDPAVSRFVHGGQSVRAIPSPWLDHHGASGAFSWNRAHGVHYMQGCINGGNTSFMHPAYIRSHHGPHNVYHHPLPPPPMPPVQPQNMDIHLQMASTSNRHSTNTSAFFNLFQNGVDLGPRFVGPILPPGLTHRQELMVDSSARVPPEDEVVELNGNVASGLSENFISDRLKTRRFSHFEDLILSVEEPDLCVICQMEFEEQEEIGILNCWHEYHADCIKKWLLVKNNCPVCKSTALT